MEKNSESHLKQTRVFKPTAAFAKRARIGSLAQYRRLYRESIDHPKKFWAREAKELTWQKPWSKVLEWKPPFAKWFVGGRLNISENCLDRHLDGPRRNKAAIIWEGEPGEKRVLTYQQLYREVCRFANVLKRNPRMHVLVMGGYFDLATTYFSAVYEIKHLPIPQPLQDNIEYQFFPAGHEAYVNPDARRAMHDRMARFIQASQDKQ